MLFTMWISLLTVISKNILPKILNSIGIVLWIYFSMHPNAIIQHFILKIFE